MNFKHKPLILLFFLIIIINGLIKLYNNFRENSMGLYIQIGLLFMVILILIFNLKKSKLKTIILPNHFLPHRNIEKGNYYKENVSCEFLSLLHKPFFANLLNYLFPLPK